MGMTNSEACKWLMNLRNDIGAPHYECLWPYAQAIDDIVTELEDETLRLDVEPDYKKYISVEWLQRYATLYPEADLKLAQRILQSFENTSGKL